jgi:hypothetical protein
MNDSPKPLYESPYLIPSSRVAVGVDLGQSKDPTSIAVVEQSRRVIAPHTPHCHVRALEEVLRTEPSKYAIRSLEQAPLGESYPAQAQLLKRTLSRQSVAEHDPEVWVDYTGVGRAVFDIFRQERVPNIKALTITFAGQAGPNGHGGHSVPKVELVSNLHALMHTGRLRVPLNLPMGKAFRRELAEFQVSYSNVGNARFGAREGAHDDLILAVALAVYGLQNERRAYVQPFWSAISGGRDWKTAY